MTAPVRGTDRYWASMDKVAADFVLALREGGRDDEEWVRVVGDAHGPDGLVDLVALLLRHLHLSYPGLARTPGGGVDLDALVVTKEDAISVLLDASEWARADGEAVPDVGHITLADRMAAAAERVCPVVQAALDAAAASPNAWSVTPVRRVLDDLDRDPYSITRTLALVADAITTAARRTSG
ncbi:hypothetical protein ACFFSW_24260 [Saccharothrix longispora]|uniref:Golgi phosphoprotein 3 GPP34 n=1 Tax=Saccharothrix longispora TaxID=33920 RepID=A0ABU1PR15_9PSEU|nr:hypothetical protein [Saccharothrix longispora]MDR6592708.1 hypothetical protein [Saccharothrix longispora]